DVAFDPAQERYVLVWSSSIEGTSNLYVCLLDATGLPLPECNGPRMAATNWDASIAVTTLLDDSHTPSRLVVTFAKTAGIAPSVRTKVVNADLTNLDEDTGAEVYAVNGEWLTIILDKPHDRIIHANSPAHTQGPFLYEQALGSFPGGPIRSLPLRNVSGLNQQWQPEFKVMPSADLLLMRTEQFGAGGSPYWSAIDLDYADGEMPSQTDPSPLTGFAVPSNIGVFDAYSRRSVIVVNDESSFSVIGSSTDSRQIVATRIVPFRANAGVLIDASASGSTWHGGEAR